MQDPKKLKLTDVRVAFYTAPDDKKVKEEGYKPSITVEISPAQKKEVEEFVARNKVGKNGDPNKGVAKITDYTYEKTGDTVSQYTIKFNDKTKWAGLNGLGQDDMGRGAVVNVIANAYEYTKYGGGVAMSASAIVVTKGATTSNDDDLEELLDDLGEAPAEDIEESVVPF